MEYVTKKFDLTKNDTAAYVLIKHSLYRTIVQGKSEPYTVYQFFNRLLVLFQQPTVFTIYEKNADTGMYERLFHTFTDPINAKKHSENLRDLEPEKYLDNLIRIYDTDYYLLAQRVYRREKVDSQGRVIDTNLSFEYYNQETFATFKILKAIFHSSEDEEKDDPLGKFLAVKKHIKAQLYCYTYPEAPEFLEMDKQASSSTPIFDIQTKWISIAEKILDDCYKTYENSPLLSRNNSTQSPRICYFIRTYDRDRENEPIRRFDGNYDYRVRMVIPETQEKNIVKIFADIEKILENGIEDHWTYAENTLNHFPKIEFIELFIKELQKNKVDGIIQILKSPSGPYVRSFLDPVFSSGFCDIRRTALAVGFGLDRVLPHHWDDEEARQDVIRIVAMFYLFSAMASELKDNPDGRVSCYAKPLRVGYSTWLSFVTFSEFDGPEKEDFLNWMRFYHFYHDIAIPQGDCIRREMKQAYFQAITEATYRELKKVYFQGGRNEISFNDLTDGMHDSFKVICRMVPYRLPQVRFRMGHKTPLRFYVVEDDCYIEVQLVDNPYYPRHVDLNYEKVNEVADAIKQGQDQFLYEFDTGTLLNNAEQEKAANP